MKVFITSSYKEGRNKEEILYLCSLVKKSGFEDFSFIRDIENFKKVFNNPKELMQRATEEIEKCDALLIDMTNKPTGRAIEAGIAYALNKKVIAIMQKGTNIKDAPRGICDAIIEYEKIDEIIKPLSKLYQEWVVRV